MKILARFRLFGLVLFLSVRPSLAQSTGAPALAIRQVKGGQIQLNWPATAAGFVVEQTDALARATVWQPVAILPTVQGNELSLTLPVSAGSHFFRLRQELTRVNASSPVNGETGVAVTRETIIHFSAPLAANAVVTANNFYAGFGGRRILSRVELASDRTKASLFYLEPLPGSARVNVVFDGAGLSDANGQPLDADGDGIAGGVAVIGFETLNLTALAGTAVVGKVFASELMPGTDTGTNAVNKPLAGVTITVDGMEQTLRTVTDATGSFTLSPVPPGRFFVHIDGRTATDAAAGIHYPDKAYYPFVGKAWEAVAGRTNNLAGGTGKIYLPLITVGTLQAVSMTQDTMISFPSGVLASNPALAGVSITVPANSLFSDDGTRGGKVGIAPVPPDRLPGPLPPGLELPIVITVQTDGGLNFDKPAPICFPNLPDPVLKTPLPAGSKQALISFNHKKGIWEAVGSMTVSADGKFVCTDPGVGIRQPGWHGVGPNPFLPPLQPPRPPPCGFGCHDICLPNLDNCLNEILRFNHQMLEFCEDDCSVFFSSVHCFGNCLDDASDVSAYLRTTCRLLLDDCGLACDTCNLGSSSILSSSSMLDLQSLNRYENERVPAVASISRQAAASSDPIGDQLNDIIGQIIDLIRPFSRTQSPFPTNVLNQLQGLRQKADILASGNAREYLKNRTVKAEEAFVAAARALGLEPDDLRPGNAPPYPVLYAARIARLGGQFILRGETGPFGQYSLFVPRDGTLLYVSFYDARTKQFGLITPYLSPNAEFRLPRFTLSPLANDAPDFDRDGLPNLVEAVYGTDPTKPDTDGDGIADGAEVDQGTNPLDGQPVRTGIVGTAKTPGSAVDIAAANDLLAVAEGTSGVSLLSVSDPMNPVLIGQVDTPGNAQAIAISGNFVAVADGDQGLAIIDVSDLANARIVHQVPLGGNALAVAAAAKFAYVILSNPRLVSQPNTLVKIDLLAGIEIERLSVGGTSGILDVAVAGDEVYVLNPTSLLIFGETNGSLKLLGQLVVASNGNARQLFAGGGLSYVGQITGHSVIDVSNPAKPILLGAPPTAQLGLQDIVTTGSGLLVATTSLGPNPQQVALYDASQPTNVTKFLTLFDTPGEARALTIHNGLGYVADNAAGIQVINYLPFDKSGIPPSINLTTSASGGLAEVSKSLRATANARDDVQVRNVEFYVDGMKAFSDGNFPFEYRFEPPALTAIKTNFTVRARAIDTGGNFTWSEELTIKLGPDVTPPRITATSPLGGAKVVSSLLAYFNEPMNPATLNTASFKVISGGADGLLDTADDLPVGGGGVSYQAENRSVSLNFATPLPDGLYRAVVTTAVADASGNRLASDYTWQFRVAKAVFWSRNADGLWDDRANWSVGAVPGPTDDVFIESIPGDVTITHASGTSAIRSLVVGERMTILGGTLQVSGTIELHQPLTLNNGTLKGGAVKQTEGAKLLFAPNTLNTLDGLRVEGDLELTNTLSRALIRNGLTLTGSVILDNTGTITFSGDQTFHTGQVIFAGTPGVLGIEPGTTLTLGPAMVVRGKSGNIGQGVISGFGMRKLINQGVILADVAGGTFTMVPSEFENAGTLECKNGGVVALSVNNAAVVAAHNTGAINASSGGTLTLNGTWNNAGTITANEATVNLGGTFTPADLGTFNRTGGTVNLTGVLDLGGGTLTLDAATGPWRMNGGTFKGGTVKQTEGGKLRFAANTLSTLDGLRVEGDLELTNTFSRALIRNGLTLTGSVILDNTGAITFSGDQTFNTGQVVFAGTPGILGIEPGTTLTLGPAMVVRGKSGNIGQGVISGFGMRKLINQGVILADVAGGTFTINPTQFENPGTLRADGTGASVVIRVTPFTNTGTIQEANGGKVVIVP
ncbi:MAG: Ig-like domain-containing protein [Verrucomicrobia bacterium]|nr:Ig-like domain-containing protein [Verrucomicrobiota bacterium]